MTDNYIMLLNLTLDSLKQHISDLVCFLYEAVTWCKCVLMYLFIVLVSSCQFTSATCLLLLGNRMLEGHVLCSVERQSVNAVVVYQLRDSGEHTATLIQRVA